MADIERIALWKAISIGELGKLDAAGIKPEHFYDEETQEVFEYALEFLTEYKQEPTLSAIKEEFPAFRAKLSREPLDYHIKRLVRHIKSNKAIELVRFYHGALEDPEQIDEIDLRAMEMARELSEIIPSSKAAKLSDGMQRKAEYDRRKRKGISHGIMLGIPTFDAIMLGVQPHELGVIAGSYGLGKTTVLQYISVNAYLQARKVMFISLEVEEEQIMRKFDVMLSNVRYLALKALDLDTDEEEAWTKILYQCEADRDEREIIVKDDIRNCSPQKIEAEIWREKPDLCVVDYLEEMVAPRGIAGWEGIKTNGRELKQMARTNKIPIITATQINREGEVSYQSIGKQADFMIVLSQDEDQFEAQEMEALLRKHRDGPSNKTVILDWKLERMQIKERDAPELFPLRPAPRERKKENPLLAFKKSSANGHRPKGLASLDYDKIKRLEKELLDK